MTAVADPAGANNQGQKRRGPWYVGVSSINQSVDGNNQKIIRIMAKNPRYLRHLILGSVETSAGQGVTSGWMLL